MAKKNVKNNVDLDNSQIEEVSLDEFLYGEPENDEPEFEVNNLNNFEIKEDYFVNKEPEVEVNKIENVNIEENYVDKKAEGVQWEKEEQRIQNLISADDKNLTAREMQEKYGIMRGRGLTVDGKDANDVDQKEVQNAYTEKFREIDDKRQAEIAEEKAYRAVADKKDSELSAEEMRTKYTGKMARGEEVPDDIWDKIEEKDFKAKYGNGTIKKDTEQLKEEAEQKKRVEEEKRDKKREKEFEDINKGIEELGQQDELPDNVDNENIFDELEDEQVKRENQVKHAQLFDEIVTDELEGLEELEQINDKINESKPEGLDDTFNAIQKANEANGVGRFEVGENNNAPQVDYVKMMMQNDPRYKEFLEFQAMQEAVNKQTNEPQEVKPVEETKQEEKEPEQVNNEVKPEGEAEPEENDLEQANNEVKPEGEVEPEEQKKEEQKPEFKRFEVEEYVDKEKESIIANNSPDSNIVKNYKKEQEKEQKKEEKRGKELQDKVDEAFAPAEEGEDQKEIDDKNKLLMTEEEETQSLENQKKEAQEKETETTEAAEAEKQSTEAQNEKEETESTPEAKEAKEKDDLFDKYHPGLKGKHERGEEISEKEADKNFEVPLGTRNEILEEMNNGEENHRPDCGILLQFKLLIHALIPMLFKKECEAYLQANAAYYKKEGEIEARARDKYKKERDGIEKKYAEQKKAREAAEKEKKAEERERRLEEHNKKLEELLAQKNNPQKDVNVPQGNTTAELNQSKELDAKKDNVEINKNNENTVQQEKTNKEENKDLQEVKKDEEKNKDVKKEELQQVGDSNKEVEKNFAPDDTRKASPERLAKLNDLSMKMKSNIPGVQKAAEESAKKELAGMLYDKAMANLLENTKGAQGKELYEKGMNPEVREKQIEKLLKSNDKRVQAALKPENLDKILARQGDAPLELFDTFKKVHKNEKLKDERDIRKILDKENNKKMEKEAADDFQNIGMGL